MVKHSAVMILCVLQARRVGKEKWCYLITNYWENTNVSPKQTRSKRLYAIRFGIYEQL